jgi:hypothetical protein
VRRAAGERRSTARAGQAFEPPPTIRPKAVPPRPPATAKPVKAVGPGAAEVDAATQRPATAQVEVAASPGGKPKRSFRTSKQTTAVTTLDEELDDDTRTSAAIKPGAIAESVPSYAPVSPPPPPPAGTATVVAPRSHRAHITTAADVAAAAEAAQAAQVAKEAKEAVAAAAAAAATTAAAAATAQAAPVDTSLAASVGGVKVKGKGKSSTTPRGARKIKLHLSYISPLSVMKLSFLLALCFGIALVVMVYVVWNALDAKEVFVKIDDMITQVFGDTRPKQLDILNQLERGRIMSGATMLAAVEVVILTVISTIGAILYDLVAALVGGIKVTLREK